MEDADKSQGHGKFPRICKFLQKIYPKFQLYGKTTEWIEGQKGIGME